MDTQLQAFLEMLEDEGRSVRIRLNTPGGAPSEIVTRIYGVVPAGGEPGIWVAGAAFIPLSSLFSVEDRRVRPLA